MDALRELLKPVNLLYLIPILFATAGVMLSRVGFQVDLLGFVDSGESRFPRLNRVLNAVFPYRDLRGLSLALFALGWSSTGLALNHGFREQYSFPIFLVSFAFACSVGLSASFLGTRILNRILPSEHKTTSLDNFIGATATVLSEVVDDEHGRARLVDFNGNTVTVHCRHMGDGEHPTHGTKVTIVGYDPDARVYDVMP